MLKEEHKIWNKTGGSMHCNGMVLELGNDDFLFEYKGDYLDIPGTIGRMRWAGLDETGEWRAGGTWKDNLFAAHTADRPEHRIWRSIISPVFPDGWVLAGETSEPSLTQIESVAAYNVHTEETLVGMAVGDSAADPWLIKLLERHRGWLATLADARWQEMLRWGGSVTANGGAIDMPFIYRAGSPALLLEDEIDTIVRFKQFQAMATQRNFMFRDMQAFLRSEQRTIGMRADNVQNVPYISMQTFRIDESLVRELGMAIVRDRGGRIHVLQLMRGSRPCAGLGY